MRKTYMFNGGRIAKANITKYVDKREFAKFEKMADEVFQANPKKIFYGTLLNGYYVEVRLFR